MESRGKEDDYLRRAGVGFGFVFLFFAKSLGRVVWFIWRPPKWDLKGSLVWKGPWICPSPTLSFSRVDGKGREDWNLQPISHWRGKLVIWLCGEGSTLCS